MEDIISRAIAKFSESYLSYSSLIITFATVYYVLMRVIAGFSDVRAFFISVWLYGILFTLGGAYVLDIGGHTSVDLLYRKLPKKTQKFIDILIYLLIAFCGIVLVIIGGSTAWKSFLAGERDASLGLLFQPPIWWYRWIAVAGALLITIQAIIILQRIIKAKNNSGGED